MPIATRSQAIAGVYSILSMNVRIYEGRSASLRQVLVGMDTIGGKLACSCIESKQSLPGERHSHVILPVKVITLPLPRRISVRLVVIAFAAVNLLNRELWSRGQNPK